MSATLLIGLGNPGKEYAETRHNIGFKTVEALAHEFNAPWKAAHGGKLAEAVIDGKKTYLFEPLKFMNNSGGPTGELTRYFNIPPESIIVFHDELALPLGKVRVKRGGGSAGHNGLRSIDQHLENNEYQRVRIGIDHPGDKDMVSDYVLSDFSKQEQKLAALLIMEMTRHIKLLLSGDDAGFMNKIALAIKE